MNRILIPSCRPCTKPSQSPLVVSPQRARIFWPTSKVDVGARSCLLVNFSSTWPSASMRRELCTRDLSASLALATPYNVETRTVICVALRDYKRRIPRPHTARYLGEGFGLLRRNSCTLHDGLQISQVNLAASRGQRVGVQRKASAMTGTTGHLCPRSGIWLAKCCGERIALSVGERFPPCRRCDGPATWTLVQPT